MIILTKRVLFTAEYAEYAEYAEKFFYYKLFLLRDLCALCGEKKYFASFKAAPNHTYCPVGSENMFLTLDIDGYDLESDHYLWLTGVAAFMLKQGIPFPGVQPIRFPADSLRLEAVLSETWKFEKWFMEIKITINNNAVSKIVLYKKAEEEGFDKFKPIATVELKNGTCCLRQKWLKKDKPDIYMFAAFDSQGKVIGFSHKVSTQDIAIK